MLVVFDWEGDLGSNPASAIKHTGLDWTVGP